MMNKQEYNRLAAEFLGLNFQELDRGILIMPCNGVLRGYSQIFNPYDDANDMLLLEREIKMNTAWYYLEKVWTSFVMTEGRRQIEKWSNDPHESRRACAEEYLKECKK